MNKTDQVLRSMGYRQLDQFNGIWAKPIGFSILVYETRTSEWTQKFRHFTTGETMVWTSVHYHGGPSDFLDWLTNQEAYSFSSISQGKPWNFTTDEDRAAAMETVFT